MRAAVTAGVLAWMLVTAGAAPAFPSGNLSGTGLPSQSCPRHRGCRRSTPGNSNSSPGSPLNEAGIDSVEGGIGGQHYNETSQYDVACYQVSQH